VVGVLAVVVGSTLVFRPFASLAVLIVLVVAGLVLLAVGELSQAPPVADRRVAAARAALWIAGAVVILLRPGLGIHALAVVVGVLLVIDGIADIAGALRAGRPERLAAFLGGAAAILLGLLALSWPGVTLLVVAVVFGARVVWLGVTITWAALRGPRPAAEPAAPSRLTRSWHVVRALVSLAVTLVLVGVSSALQAGTPRPDGFYDPPDRVPAQAGRLLRTEPFTRDVPAGARAWRILYTTTRDEGQPAVASALVVAPRSAGEAPMPVVAWAHGTTGTVPGCAPSVLPHPFEAGATPALDQVVARGWVMVATDYVGLGTAGPHPYLIGQGEGRSVLDAVRAAHQIAGLTLGDRTVVWGHSQGGHAALWAGQLADSYAPDDHVVGVAALAPASNLTGLVGNLAKIPGGAIFASYVIASYAEIYPDVHFDDYVRPTARIQVHEMAGRCLAEPEVFVSIVSSLLFDKTIWSEDPREGALGRRLAENTPLDPIPAPLLIGQGAADPLVLPSAQAAYVRQRCALGGTVDYRTYPGYDHVGVVSGDSPLIPQLLRWTADRFAGRPARSTC
jgi:uncharacterized membrane protein HdeD (DUF308 family)